MLGIWESIFDLVMLILGLITYFGLLGLDFRALGVYHEPREADIWSLQVNLGPVCVYDGHIEVKFEPLGVDFGPLRVEFRFCGINLGLMTSMLGIW